MTPEAVAPAAKGAQTKDSPHMVALVLQGGGALGAYHIGAYEALHDDGFEPDWITGISIGAINSAVLAGNRPDQRLGKLTGLWEDISRPDFFSWSWLREIPLPFQRMVNNASSLQAFIFGQPNFFVPRFPSPQFLPYVPTESASYYDTSPMLATLRRYADFDLIDQDTVRLSLGATDVERGELKFFNNWQEKITPNHVLASGSLPPGFPAIRLNGGWYWDGGCISNSPLEAILQNPPDRPVLVFMIDLWGANGPPPTSMDQVAWRQKQIQYASRTSYALQTATQTMNLCHRLAKMGAADDLPAPLSRYLSFGHNLDIVHITYNPSDDQVSTSDAEFSRSSIAERREAGLRDMRAALAASPWQAEKRMDRPAVVHSVRHGHVQANALA